MKKVGYNYKLENDTFLEACILKTIRIIGTLHRCVTTCTIFGVLFLSGSLFLTAAQDTILMFRPEGENFQHAAKGMIDDLNEEIEVIEKIVKKKTTPKDLLSAIQKFHPAGIVLMDNSTIRLYKKCLKESDNTALNVPVVAFMTILVEKAVTGIENVATISYEVPIVTSSVILRSLSSEPLKKIGVIHREIMRDLFDNNQKLCLRENISIINRCIECSGTNSVKSVKKALKYLIKKEKVDALWLPNDNTLLTKKLLKDVWIPMINKFQIPVIVGVEVLANPRLHLGTLAVMPDHEALGVQAAQMLLNISDDGWKIGQNYSEPALSVKKVLNLNLAESFLKLNNDVLLSIDKVLK